MVNKIEMLLKVPSYNVVNHFMMNNHFNTDFLTNVSPGLRGIEEPLIYNT